MASTNTLTWTTFYARHRNDEGAIQSLFDQGINEFLNTTISHFEAPHALAQTIGGSAYANVMLVPGEIGRMNLLHHGFSCNTEAGFALIFVQGNLSDCSYFKVLPVVEATDRIRSPGEGPRRTTGTINCPSLDAMREATTADGFAELVAQGNVILKKKPNHILVPPTIFLMADGETDVTSKNLAINIIDAIRIDPEMDDDEEMARKEGEAQGLELLLAMLWASHNGGLTPVTLSDIRGNPTLNQITASIKDKLRSGGGGVTPPAAGGAIRPPADAESWALASQSIILELNRIQENREADKSLQAATKSLLRSLGPEERALFTTLSTTDMTIEPEMSDFMKTLTMTNGPLKAIGLLRAATRSWEGTFSEGCCHQLLSTGFLSQNSNLANPGGFTVFMFHPKTMDMGSKTFDKNTARLREYFDMDVEDDTIAYYAKQGFFHPKNPNDLRTQLQTAHDMLELLTCKQSIATVGLAYILQPKRWQKMITILNDRFRTQPSFGSKFVYSIDRTLQNFFDQITDCDDIATDGDPTYLTRKAMELIEKVVDGVTLAIELPAALLSTPKATGEPATKKAKTATKRGTESATKTASRKKPLVHSSDEHINTEPHPSWTVAPGTDYLDLFTDRAPGTKRWPKVVDKRLAKKGRPPVSAPLCVKFQMTGKCVQGCTLAHVNANAMTVPEFNQADRIMKDILATNTPGT
jgi:hypothetical protein